MREHAPDWVILTTKFLSPCSHARERGSVCLKEATMMRHGRSVFSHGIIVVKDFIARRANTACPPFPMNSPVNPMASCKRPPRRGLVRRAVALITATVFGILPPLQAAAQDIGRLSVRQQVAAANRSMLRAPSTVAA